MPLSLRRLSEISRLREFPTLPIVPALAASFSANHRPPRTLVGWIEVPMDYRGKHYTIVRGHGPDSWTWTVRLDDKNVKFGEAKSRAAARNSAVWLIDKALAPNEAKLILPSGTAPAQPESR